MYGQIDANIINEIKSKADILEIVAEKVRLQKKGRYYFGRCPFHLEDTPSFSVSRERQMYYCFGCHAGGDIFSFLMQTDGLTFMEAAESIAQRVGVTITTTDLNPIEKKVLEEREQLYHINSLATKWFQEQLNKTREGNYGLEYLRRRSLSDETISLFQLGFAPASWDKLTSFLTKQGFSPKLLLQAGLSIENNSDSFSMHDRFRNRIIFPIHDYRGRVVAFGGRVLDDSLPKYLNSPETPVFNKSQNLYGLSLAAQTVRQQDEAVLVEGYMDVISCHQNGVTNAVASLGTALTPEQGKLMLRYTDKVYFAYDSDAAGKKAIQKGIYVLTDLGLHVKVINFTDTKDPDEYFNKYGIKGFQNLITHAQPAFSFLLDTLINHKDMHNPTEKAEIVKELFPFINKNSDVVVREEYLKQMAYVLSVNESAVYTEFRKFQKKLPQDVNFSQKFGKNTLVNSKQLKECNFSIDKIKGKILAAAFQDTDKRKVIAQLIDFPFLDNDLEEKLFDSVIHTEYSDPEELINLLSDELKVLARYILFNEAFLLEGKETIEDLINFLKRQYIKGRLEEINLLLARYNFSGGLTEEFKKLLSESQALQAKLK